MQAVEVRNPSLDSSKAEHTAAPKTVEEPVAFLNDKTTTQGGLARDAGGSATEAKKRYELEQIRKAIAVLFDPAQVVEVRMLNRKKRITVSGWFDDHEVMAR